MGFFVLFVFIIVLLLSIIHKKTQFIKTRRASEKLTAEIIEYRSERGPMRNDYTLLEYPYVRIGAYDTNLIKLKYANNTSRPFEIGERVSVFWYEDDLMCWDALDRGLYKYLPERWNFKKSKS